MYEDIGHSNEARKTMKKYLLGNLEVSAALRAKLSHLLLCQLSVVHRISLFFYCALSTLAPDTRPPAIVSLIANRKY